MLTSYPAWHSVDKNYTAEQGNGYRSLRCENGGQCCLSCCSQKPSSQRIAQYFETESGNCDSDTFDHVQYRLDCLYRIIRRCFDAGFLGERIDFLTSRAFDQKTKRTTFRKSSERVVTVVKEALDCFELNDTSVMYHAGKVFIYLFYLFIFQILALHR